MGKNSEFLSTKKMWQHRTIVLSTLFQNPGLFWVQTHLLMVQSSKIARKPPLGGLRPHRDHYCSKKNFELGFGNKEALFRISISIYLKKLKNQFGVSTAKFRPLFLKKKVFWLFYTILHHRSIFSSKWAKTVSFYRQKRCDSIER